jgi:hypothetical protein
MQRVMMITDQLQGGEVVSHFEISLFMLFWSQSQLIGTFMTLFAISPLLYIAR